MKEIPMKLERIREAAEEAKRFLRRVGELEKARDPEVSATWGGEESASVRRASMDLTKALEKIAAEELGDEK